MKEWHFQNMQNNWLIFTDLDGTLLDFETYDFSAALPAIKFLKRKGIPIIPCTSKTLEEVQILRKKLFLNDPFIVENGSAIFFEADFFKQDFKAVEIESFKAKILGKSHNEILDFYHRLKEQFALKITGFSEMNLEEIQLLTLLSKAEAKLAKQRQFSQPMVSFEDNDLLSRSDVKNFILEHGFRLLKGNRFYHLIGQCDKGMAVKTLVKMYSSEFQHSFKSMGLGDSKNDFEMLKVVDQPIIIRKKDGNFVDLEGIRNLYITQNAGPTGWAEAIFKFVKNQ